MIGGVIGGNFECGNGQFSNDNAIALNASGIEVNGIVYLGDGFKAEGKVCLTNAIVGRLNCCGGHFLNEDSNALTADSLKVDGDVNFCNRSMVDGKVSLINAKINGSFIWSGIGSPTKVTLDLRFAKLRSLVDNPSSWPGEGRLFLHGLIYDEIDGIEPVSVQARLKWLRRQPSGHFWPQPYEQLSMVLRKQGRDEDAKHILIEKNRDRARRMRLSVSEWWWYYVFGPMICYGYCPWKALWFVFLIIGLGWIVFWIGFRSGVMTPTKKDAYSIEKARKDKPLSDEYPKFNSFIYSVDTFIPLVDLQIAKYWLPNANLKGGRFLRLYLWIHILFGWLLTTLIVVGLTGLVRS
jgi:hypothetical protein